MTLFDDGAPQPHGDVVRAKATVAYDGTGYAGFAVQPGHKTIGGALTDAISKQLGHAVELACAGRTDAGVHAWGQVISFDAQASRFDPDGLRRSVNKQLRPAIAIRECERAPADFDARFSAVARRYRYTILNSATPSPFTAHTAWWIEWPLDLRAMRLAVDPLIGEHDFSAFCRRPKTDGEPASLTRTVRDARWESDGETLEFWIEANAFCHQMVRSIVGTLVEVGLGKKRAGDVRGILEGGDRAKAGSVAPAHGLCLWAVEYEP